MPIPTFLDQINTFISTLNKYFATPYLCVKKLTKGKEDTCLFQKRIRMLWNALKIEKKHSGGKAQTGKLLLALVLAMVPWSSDCSWRYLQLVTPALQPVCAWCWASSSVHYTAVKHAFWSGLPEKALTDLSCGSKTALSIQIGDAASRFISERGSTYKRWCLGFRGLFWLSPCRVGNTPHREGLRGVLLGESGYLSPLSSLSLRISLRELSMVEQGWCAAQKPWCSYPDMSAAALGNGKQSRRRNGESLHRGKVQRAGNLDLFPVSKGEGSATWSTCFPCRASPKSQPLLLIAPRAATVMLSTAVPWQAATLWGSGACSKVPAPITK